MFDMEQNNQKIGAYLQKRISEKYISTRQFCIDYLRLRGDEPDDEATGRMANRFSQIIKGNKTIQTYDLPFVTELLGVSCEELLSAGKTFVPISGHMTNYEIAFSHDRAVWEKYMKREDKLFLNCDEYGKSVIDYAQDFDNFDFIKYLLDEGFIWFVDQTDKKQYSGFGAGTSVERRRSEHTDSFLPEELIFQDRLRTRTIAMAVRHGDSAVLDSLRAREVPELRNAHSCGYPDVDTEKNRSEELIEAVAKCEGEMLEYFTDEFSVANYPGEQNTFVFPYLADVIGQMLQIGKIKEAEFVIRKALRHNQDVFDRLTALMNEERHVISERCQAQFDSMGEEYVKREAELEIKNLFRFDEKNAMVSFYYCPEKRKHIGMISNVVFADASSGNPQISELLDELNESAERICRMGGEDA